MAWLAGWRYRKQFSISRSSGAVTNYQIKFEISTPDLNYHCLESFNDLRFTNESGDVLNYWIEEITGASPDLTAKIWIKFDSIITTDTNFYLYYGKSNASSISNGSNTFGYFINNSNTTGWTKSNEEIAISTNGDFLKFYKATHESLSDAYRSMSLTNDKNTIYIGLKHEDMEVDQEVETILHNSATCIADIKLCKYADQTHWYYNNGTSDQIGGDLTKSTEYVFKISVDEINSKVSYYQYNTSYSLLSSITDSDFPSVTSNQGLEIKSNYYFNLNIKWLFYIEWLSSEPDVGSFSEEEETFIGLAAEQDYRDGDYKVNKMYLGMNLIYRREPKFYVATGGNTSYYGDYKIHTFLSSGNFIITYQGDYTGTGIEYLIVGGGGGGGTLSYACGGGGAGGMLYGAFTELNPTLHPVVVGQGGAINSNGGNSSFNSLIAYGGGAGGAHEVVGSNGGCGGGAGGTGSVRLGGIGSQGFNGGEGDFIRIGYSSYYASGGGGGMGTAGQDATQTGANGGNGITSAITGNSVYYGGGGAGTCCVYTSSVGNGGLGGGGGKSHINGYTNTGGGGSGGLSWGGTSNPGTGGSGIVIIRYKYK